VWRGDEKLGMSAHKHEIMDLYSEFDVSDWDFLRSAIDGWISDHLWHWLDYALKHYNAPPVEQSREKSGVMAGLMGDL
jgi:hypothetical protein